MKHLALIMVYGCIYAAFNWWTENTVYGIALKKYLQEWNTDWKHGIMCSISVFILGVCAILALALGLEAIY